MNSLLLFDLLEVKDKRMQMDTGLDTGMDTGLTDVFVTYDGMTSFNEVLKNKWN